MRYTVCWTQLAENDLADIWLKAFDRAAVTDAANRVDRILEQDALAAGAIREDSNHHLIVPRSSSSLMFRPQIGWSP